MNATTATQPLRGRAWRLVLLALVLMPGKLEAQRASISGVVRNQALAPVPGAYVTLPALGLSVAANDAGAYRLVVPDSLVRGQSVVLRGGSIGYRERETVVLLEPGSLRVDFVLAEEAIALDEVVVTGTAGARERRALAAVVDVVHAAELARSAPVHSVADLLAARVPGLSVSGSSGSAGSAPILRARGHASIHAGGNPIVFIDGIRADGRAFGAGVGGQATSRLNDLNPEDIERIEVVKGPAAATLFGADATAGVIQIFTKRGRPGSGRFAQSFAAEYGGVDPNWTPPANFAVCGAAAVDPESPSVLCHGAAEGTVVQDNPLVREGVLRDGRLRSLRWSGRGGGDAYGYFISLEHSDETGTLPQNAFERTSGRINVQFVPEPRLSFDAGVGVTRTSVRMPQNNDNPLGFMAALIGSPLSVGPQGTGWPLGPLDSRGIAAAEMPTRALRLTPTLTVRYTPGSSWQHRLTLGADASHTEVAQFFPRNELGWYGPELDAGFVGEERDQFENYTLDYAGSVTIDPRARWLAELSFGAQLIASRTDNTYTRGFGLLSNSTRAVAATASRTGTQYLNRERSAGGFAEGRFSWENRAFLDLGVRIDRSSVFGEHADPIVMPRVGVSWVTSDEPWWSPLAAVVKTFRLRAAFGTTGRLPTIGEALRTYEPAPFVTPEGGVSQGFTPARSGNPRLRAERGTELELGFDAALLDDRLSLELTWFDKATRDLLVRRPVPPSTGFPVASLVNLGEVVNRGVELSALVRLVEGPDVSWDASVSAATLRNEVLDIGDASYVNDPWRIAEGRPLGAYFTRRVRSIDRDAGLAIVSDTAEYAGTALPRFEGSMRSTVTAFGRLSATAVFAWKTGHRMLNATAILREQIYGTAETRVREDALSEDERLRRFGPFVTESGTPVSPGEVADAYVQDAGHVRWQELALTYTLPGRLTRLLRATAGSITIAGRNLGLWSDYGGTDPDVVTLASERGAGRLMVYDALVMPHPRRWSVRVDLQFQEQP